MTDGSISLGKRVLEPPVLCGLRCEAIARDMAAMKFSISDGLSAANARSKAIEDSIGNALEWVVSVVGSLAVALRLMFLNNKSHTQQQADDCDKREMRARLSLLTQRLANVQPRALAVTPPGSQTTAIPPDRRRRSTRPT